MPGPNFASLTGNRVLYRDGIPLAFLEGNSTRFLEPVEPEIENRARPALHGHAEPAALPGYGVCSARSGARRRRETPAVPPRCRLIYSGRVGDIGVHVGWPIFPYRAVAQQS